MPENKVEEMKVRGLNLSAPKTKPMNLGRSWFLGIGINTYLNWPNLNNAVKDVEEIAVILLEEYDLEGECSAVIKDEEATIAGITRELERLKKEVKPEDKVLIYYSGHGYLDAENERGYWVPHNADDPNTEGADYSKFLRNSTLMDYLVDIKSLHTLLISDACFSGALFNTGTARSNTAALEELSFKASRWVLCSGRSDQEVADGAPGKNSPFAAAIKHVLTTNSENLININAVYLKVMHQVKGAYQMQLPLGSPMAVKGHDWGEYIFKRKVDDELLWKITQKKNTLQAYSDYLQRAPKGKYVQEATKEVEAFQERDAWTKASKLHQIKNYNEFLRRFPSGYYQDPAGILLAILSGEENEDFFRELPGYDDYIRKELEPKEEAPPAEIEEDDLLPDNDEEGVFIPGPEKGIEIRNDLETFPAPPPPPKQKRIRKGKDSKKETPQKGRIRDYIRRRAETYKYDSGLCVILDAGHGGLDEKGNYVTAPGKMFLHPQGEFHKGSFFYEGVWNRTLVNRLEELLDENDISNMVLSHDYEDTSLQLRASMANRYYNNYNDCLLLSIHANSSIDPLKRGMQVFNVGSPEAMQYSKYLVENVQAALGNKAGLGKDPQDAIHKANFYLLKSTSMPAILVEHLYITNYEDAVLLMQEEVVEQFAQAHLQAIKAYQAYLKEKKER